MSERLVPESLQDNNATLSLAERAQNISVIYQQTIPNLVAREAPLDVALQEIHATAMQGQNSAAGLEGTSARLIQKGIDPTQVSLPSGRFRDRATTDLLGYVTALKGYSSNVEDGPFILHITCPGEEVVPNLMAGIAGKFEAMRTEIESPEDAVRLSAWASQLAFIVHPFYDGNGRSSRAAFTYALERCQQPPIVLENERANASERALPFLTGVNLNLILRLYGRHMDALPAYIPATRMHVTARDILGLPDYAPEEKLKVQKQRSLEYLLNAHLGTVDFTKARTLFTDEEVAQYQASNQSRP